MEIHETLNHGLFERFGIVEARNIFELSFRVSCVSLRPDRLSGLDLLPAYQRTDNGYLDPGTQCFGYEMLPVS